MHSFTNSIKRGKNKSDDSRELEMRPGRERDFFGTDIGELFKLETFFITVLNALLLVMEMKILLVMETKISNSLYIV